jgi:hypothetical protein
MRIALSQSESACIHALKQGLTKSSQEDAAKDNTFALAQKRFMLTFGVTNTHQPLAANGWDWKPSSAPATNSAQRQKPPQQHTFPRQQPPSQQQPFPQQQELATAFLRTLPAP